MSLVLLGGQIRLEIALGGAVCDRLLLLDRSVEHRRIGSNLTDCLDMSELRRWQRLLLNLLVDLSR